MHAGIDVLTHPCFWSLLPSRVFDRVIVAASISDVMTPLDTPLHPVSVISFALQAVFTGPSSFWLVPTSTVPEVEGLHHRKCTIAGVTHCHSPAAYITYVLEVSSIVIPIELSYTMKSKSN